MLLDLRVVRPCSCQTTGADCLVCFASSNNQHELSLDISDDPKKTSFYLAMQMCSFVLLVLDKDATPFSRIWW